MRLALLLLIFSVFAPTKAGAESTATLTDLFDAVCVSTQFEEVALKQSTIAYAKHFKLKMMDAPSDALSVLNPFAKYGWVLGGNQVFVINYAEKPVGNFNSRSCSVGSPDGNIDDIQKFIETRFTVRKILDTAQGSNRIVVYKPTLVGFPDEIYISLQEKDKMATDDRFINLSLYEAGYM